MRQVAAFLLARLVGLVRQAFLFALSWLVGFATYAVALAGLYGETWISNADLAALVNWTGFQLLLGVVFVYAPIMFWLRRRLRGVQPRYVFVLTATLLFLLPLGLYFVVLSGEPISVLTSPSPEVVLFYWFFLGAGAGYGLGFTWLYGRIQVAHVSNH
jgi:hypothetical protein